MTIERILIADDDPLGREFLGEALRNMGYDVTSVATAEDAIERLGKDLPDAVLTDYQMGHKTGVDLLKEIKRRAPKTPVAILTAYGTVERAVEAMKEGAEDFLLKPCTPETIELLMARIERGRRMLQENAYLRAELGSKEQRIVAESPLARKTLEEATRAAKSKSTVLILGESGVGKERVAHRIHQESPRKDRPFIRVNCAALAEAVLESELFGHERGAFTGAVGKREGRFELADGGTLLLDEIGEVPLRLQPKLLRVLEEQEFERVGGTKTLHVDVRVVATTNRDLAQEVKDGRFREDLYYRLNVLPIRVPALRDRIQDIEPLARQFLERYAAENHSRVKSFSAQSIQTLNNHRWPGNVRELENLIQRIVVRDSCEEIRAEDVLADLGMGSATHVAAGPGDPHVDSGMTDLGGRRLSDIEREAIEKALESTHNNKTAAARILGVTARTLSNKLKSYRLLDARFARMGKPGLGSWPMALPTPAPVPAANPPSAVPPKIQRPL
ncbi:MAG: sigma-54-dependent Fis family transcriptional regulator [Planctomycetes bacterium]|nr:sigma-54-dependent Fis family transcriptional regulator [Planctomycetota bacterium]